MTWGTPILKKTTYCLWFTQLKDPLPETYRCGATEPIQTLGWEVTSIIYIYMYVIDFMRMNLHNVCKPIINLFIWGWLKNHPSKRWFWGLLIGFATFVSMTMPHVSWRWRMKIHKSKVFGGENRGTMWTSLVHRPQSASRSEGSRSSANQRPSAGCREYKGN